MSQDTCILTQCLHFILAMNFPCRSLLAILFFQLDKIDINESQTIIEMFDFYQNFPNYSYVFCLERILILTFDWQ